MTIRTSLQGSPSVAVEIESRRVDRDAEQRIEPVLHGVWSHIDPLDRSNIASYWSQNNQSRCPIICLGDPWWGEQGSDGVCESEGKLIWLNWTTNRLMPDRIVRIILAHELAHAWQWSIGKHRFALTNDDLAGTIQVPLSRVQESGRVELHADETILRWGFDPSEHVIWKVRHLQLKKSGEWRLRRKPLNEDRSRKRAHLQQLFAYMR